MEAGLERKEARGEQGNEKVDNDELKFVHDSSVDYKGALPLRSSTGVWKAALFIITIEFSERLSFFGIATNLISYLTKVIHQDLKTAAKSVNYWSGVTTMMPLFGGFLADSYIGRFTMVLISSLVYIMGLSLLTVSQFIPSLTPCRTSSPTMCTHPRKIREVVFFVALYCLSIGTGGHKPCLESFGADQFDDSHSKERKKKMSYFNWWNFALCCGLFLGVTLIVYIQDYVSWGVANLILAIIMAITVIIFYLGKPCYRYRIPQGSPITPMFRVLVAAFKKRSLPFPSSPAQLYEIPNSTKFRGRRLGHTDRLRFLDKAAIIEEEEKEEETSIEQKLQNRPWRLTTVTEVEEVKLVLNMIPIWLTSLPFGVCVAQAPTFFVKQAATMNLKITNNFKMPPASIYSVAAIGMIISVTSYEKAIVPILRKTTGNERGLNILKRIGIGMVFSVLAMSVAAIVERERLSRAHNENNRGVGIMSVFWLAPQYILLGLGDGFTLVGLQEYFYDQVPDAMRSIGIAFYLSVIGGGSFLSSLLISVVDNVTDNGVGRKQSWFGKDLNASRLDKFYWLLAAINGFNLGVYVLVSRRYTYKNVQGREVGGGAGADDDKVVELVA